MNFERTENMTVQVTAPGEAGQPLRLATLMCSIQPGKRVSVVVELQKDYHLLTHAEKLGDALNMFVTDVWAFCRKNDLPVPNSLTVAE